MMNRDMMEWMKPFQKTFDQDFFRNFHQLFDHNDKQKQNVKINIYEGINELFCVIFAPGIDNVENVNVKVTGNTVEIDGNFNVQFDNFKLSHMEFENGDFQRIIQLPYAVREDKVDAVYKQGLLIIHLYKKLTIPENSNRILIKNVDE